MLVLDEPTSSLTQQDVERLFALIRRLRERGLAIVYISHFLEEVKEICDRFTVLRDGKSSGGGEVATTEPSAIVAMMVGRQVDDLYPRSPRTPGEVVLERARPRRALRSRRRASLELRRGEVVGIAGIVGAGRTELLRALMGLDPIRRGEVRVATVARLAAARRALAAGRGPGQRGPQGGRARARPVDRRQHHAVALRASGRAVRDAAAGRIARASR